MHKHGTLLHIAAAQGNLNCARVLLEYKADMKARVSGYRAVVQVYMYVYVNYFRFHRTEKETFHCITHVVGKLALGALKIM